MNLSNIIDWQFFTHEEKTAIKKIVKVGYIAGLTAVVPNMTREKELELQKVIDAMSPIVKDFKSKIRENIEKKGHPTDPKNEVELQLKLEEEYSEYLEKKELEALKKRVGLGDKEAVKELKDKKEEIKLREELEKEAKKEAEKREKDAKKEAKEKQDNIDADFEDRRKKQMLDEDGKDAVAKYDKDKSKK